MPEQQARRGEEERAGGQGQASEQTPPAPCSVTAPLGAGARLVLSGSVHRTVVA